MTTVDLLLQSELLLVENSGAEDFIGAPARMHRICITGLRSYGPIIATTVATAASHELCQW